MDPIMSTFLVLLMVALVVSLTGRRAERPSVVVVSTPPTAQSSGSAAGILVVFGVIVMFLALGH